MPSMPRRRLTGCRHVWQSWQARGLVVEAIVENLDAKRKLFVDLEAMVGDDCILATNTSSISVTAIAAPLRPRNAWSACTSSTRCR